MNTNYAFPFSNTGSYFPNIPSFLPTKINFYNRFTGRPEVSIDPANQMYITSLYNENGVNVTISGSKKDVDSVMCKLRGTSEDGLDEDETDETIYEIGTKLRTGVVSSSKTTTTGYYYVQNPKDSANILLITPDPKRRYSGSGIILLEKYGSQVRVILAKTKRFVFEDFGGHLDKTIKASQKTLEDNAVKELAEESQHLFWIEKLELESKIAGKNRYVDIPDATNSAYFRCYFICIEGIEDSDILDFYLRNRGIIVNSLGFGHEYFESVALDRFNLSDIEKNIAGSGGNIISPDVSGRRQTIRDRTADCLNQLLANRDILNAVMSEPIKMVNKSPRLVSNPVLFTNPMIEGGPMGEYVFYF